MDAPCDRCKVNVGPAGGIVFNPSKEGEAQQHLCMTCFEGMSGPEIHAEKEL